MAIGWIDVVANNTDETWSLKSIDDVHNGALEGGGGRFTLDDKAYHTINAQTQYQADWCGIPWYWRGRHFKAITGGGQKEVIFYTSQRDGKNWIVFEEGATRRPIGRQEVPKSVDFHCYLRFEPSGISIDVVNDDGSTQDVLTQIYDETKSWVEVIAPLLAEALKAALG